MVTIYHWENGGLKETDQLTGSCWINLADPTTDEITQVVEQTGIYREFVTDPLDKDEHPRIETDTDTDGTLLIIHVPYHESHENLIPFHTLPLGIVWTKRHVLTICNRQTPVTSTFLDQSRRICSPENRYRFIFQILWHSAILYLRYLRDIRQRADMVEQDLHESISNVALMRLMNIEKSMVYFTTSLKANEIVIKQLVKKSRQVTSEDDFDMLEDVQIEYEQALAMASIHSNILTGTLDTFASIISNNLNNVMKFLTSITIVLMLPTLLASIYGMNVPLPGMNSPYAFTVLMVLSVLLAILAAFLLARKKFF